MNNPRTSARIRIGISNFFGQWSIADLIKNCNVDHPESPNEKNPNVQPLYENSPPKLIFIIIIIIVIITIQDCQN